MVKAALCNILWGNEGTNLSSTDDIVNLIKNYGEQIPPPYREKDKVFESAT